jgi:hypothetical protein
VEGLYPSAYTAGSLVRPTEAQGFGRHGGQSWGVSEAGLDMMMALSLLFKSPLVDFFFTQRVIHALVVVAFLLFFSIGFLLLATVIVYRYRASAMKHRR